MKRQGVDGKVRQLFFHNVGRCYFLVLKDEDGVPCEACGLAILPADSLFIFRDFFKKQEYYYCASCFEPQRSVLSEAVAAFVSLIVPLNVVIVPFEQPLLVASKATVFGAALAVDGAEVKDGLRFAKNYFQSVVLAEKPKLLLEEKPVRNEAEAVDFLKELQGMQPLDSKGFEALVFKEAGVELRVGSGEVRKVVLLDRPKEGGVV